MTISKARAIGVGIIAIIQSTSAFAQSAIEHHAWQDKRAFKPYSTTANAITGTIRLSGNKKFATPGSKMTISFGNGKKASLTSVGASYRQWLDTSNEKVSAEVFRIAKDPGTLLNGNSLCGDPVSYIVFAEDYSNSSNLLSVAVFSSKKTPWDINSPGLCATYNFIIS